MCYEVVQMKRILSKLPDGLAPMLWYKNINEIALRAGKNVIVKADNIYHKLDFTTTQKDVEECVKKFCNMSLYAYLDEIQNGFITIEGGNRIGICGTGVLKDNCIHNIKNINSLNIRIANEIIGCSDKLGFDGGSLLVISPPCCGKTTLIRDLCRIIGNKHKVSIVDERGEIAGVCNGQTYFNVGSMTDVLSLVPKSLGIEYVLRSMSPEYIVTDEIAFCDCEAIGKAFSFGVNVIASAHGDDIYKTLKRTGLSKNDFNMIVLLSNKHGVGTIEEVICND